MFDNDNNTSSNEEIKKEIKRLKKYEEEYLKIVNSSSYKWIKLMEKEFIKGNLIRKLKFIFKVIKVGFKYFIITPLKKIFSKKNAPLVNGEKDYPQLNIACILDTFSYSMFKDVANFYQLTPANWKNTFKNNQIDLLFVESIWSGYKESWLGFRNKSKYKNYEAYKIINHCKDNGITTVFWNKEDPVHFDSYIDYAKLFEYVFTTDSNMIDKYKSVVKHEKVFTLIFSINPKIHNPINKKVLPQKDILFTGTYYSNHNDRIKDLEMMLRPTINFKLDIFSRHPQTPNQIEYRFPKQYQPYIRGSLPYHKMVDKYKEYKIMLNVNTVHNSPTMFSRRVIEALACETLVISSYNKAIDNILSDIVPMSKTKEDTTRLINQFLNNDYMRIKLTKKSLREIFRNHTVKHRLNYVLKKTGYKTEDKKPLYSIITVTNRIKYIKRILKNHRRQTYINKELILIINSNNIDINLFKKEIKPGERISIYQLDQGLTLGYCTNYAIEKCQGEYIAKFDDDDYYSSHYLEDTYNAFIYTDASIIGKNRYFCYIQSKDITVLSRMSNYTEENQYTTKLVLGATLSWKKSINRSGIQFGDKNMGEDTYFLKIARQKGLKVYTTDRFGYLKSKSPKLEDHAWKIEDKEIIDNSVFMFHGMDLDRVFI
jgi:spore maturation protein CgeB